MPSVPIPQQVPIERAGWSPDFNPGGLLTPPNNDRTPVNPINVAQSQAAQQAQMALQGGQTANAISEVQQRQRQQQSSMLGALAQLPPEQYESARNTLLPVLNRINPSVQYDPKIDQMTAKAAAMGGVPIEQQPQYGLTQSNAAINQALLGALGGAQGVTNAQNGQPTGQPSTGGQAGGISPAAQQLLAIARPESSNALNNITKTSYESPEVKADTALQTKNADNLADAQKTFNVAYSALPRALERFNEIRNASDKASSGPLIDNTGEGPEANLARSWLGGKIEPETAKANQTIQQAINQGVLNELGPQLQGLKGNKFLEGIASGATGLNFSDPAEVKKNAVQGLQDQYVANLKQLAAERRAYGDKNVPTDAEIDAKVKQNNGAASQIPPNMQSKSNTGTPIIKSPDDPAFQSLSKGARFIGSDGITRTKL